MSNQDAIPFSPPQVKQQSTQYTYNTPNQPRMLNSVLGLDDDQMWGEIRGDPLFDKEFVDTVGLTPPTRYYTWTFILIKA